MTVGNSIILESRRNLSGTYCVWEEELCGKRHGRKQEAEDGSWHQKKGGGKY